MHRKLSGFLKDADKLCLVLGSYSVSDRRPPILSSITSTTPLSRPKFKGMKSYISYNLVLKYKQVPVHHGYKHIHWLYVLLVERFLVISLSHLLEKQDQTASRRTSSPSAGKA